MWFHQHSWNFTSWSLLTSYLYTLYFLLQQWLLVKILGKSVKEEKKESSLWSPGERRWSLIKIQCRGELHGWGEREEEEAKRWTHCIVVSELLSILLFSLNSHDCFLYVLFKKEGMWRNGLMCVCLWGGRLMTHGLWLQLILLSHPLSLYLPFSLPRSDRAVSVASSTVRSLQLLRH